nr:MAG TPA: hypothetical protein [Caudoviricetes sp.]
MKRPPGLREREAKNNSGPGASPQCQERRTI